MGLWLIKNIIFIWRKIMNIKVIFKTLSVIFINILVNINLIYINLLCFILTILNKYIFKKKLDIYSFYLLLIGLQVVIKFVQMYK